MTPRIKKPEGQPLDPVLPFAPPVTREEREWKAKASCLGMGPSMFWPGPGQPVVPDEVRRMCNACPVSVQCKKLGHDLARTLAQPRIGGIWGGEFMQSPHVGKRSGKKVVPLRAELPVS